MKHYIYIDKEIVNSYISQIYGGILNKEQTEKNKEQRDKLIYATSVASRRSRTLMTLLKENNIFND